MSALKVAQMHFLSCLYHFRQIIWKSIPPDFGNTRKTKRKSTPTTDSTIPFLKAYPRCPQIHMNTIFAIYLNFMTKMMTKMRDSTTPTPTLTTHSVIRLLNQVPQTKIWRLKFHLSAFLSWIPSSLAKLTTKTTPRQSRQLRNLKQPRLHLY